MRPEEQDWWPDFVKAAEKQTSLLQLSKQFGANPVELAQAMSRAGIERASRNRPKAAPTPPAAPERVLRKKRPEDQDWWPRFLQVAGARSLLELGREFGVDPIELVAALDRQGIDRDSLASEAPAPAPAATKPAPEPPAEAPEADVPEAAEATPDASNTPAPADDSEAILLKLVVDALAGADAGVAASAIARDGGAKHLAVREMLVDLEERGFVYRTGRARSTRWWLG